MGNIIIETAGDINLKGSGIYGREGVELKIGGDLNSAAVEDYSREYSKTESEGGMLGADETLEKETVRVKNKGSYITSGEGAAKD
jgi:hypothetical protein